MKISTKAIAQTGLLLAICIASQFMKNLSVYITGPMVNITVIMAVLFVGVGSGILIGVISPLTAFWIAPSPILMGIPVIIPCIMIGNIVLAVSIWMFKDKILQSKCSVKIRVAIGMLVGAAAKAIFMGISIVVVLLPMNSSNIKVPAEKLVILMEKAKVTFSITQFVTAIIGCAISYVIWMRIKRVVNQD